VEIVELMSAWKIVDGKHGRTAWRRSRSLLPERGASTREAKEVCAVVWRVRTVSSTPSTTVRSSVYGRHERTRASSAETRTRHRASRAGQLATADSQSSGLTQSELAPAVVFLGFEHARVRVPRVHSGLSRPFGSNAPLRHRRRTATTIGSIRLQLTG